MLLMRSSCVGGAWFRACGFSLLIYRKPSGYVRDFNYLRYSQLGGLPLLVFHRYCFGDVFIVKTSENINYIKLDRKAYRRILKVSEFYRSAPPYRFFFEMGRISSLV